MSNKMRTCSQLYSLSVYTIAMTISVHGSSSALQFCQVQENCNVRDKRTDGGFQYVQRWSDWNVLRERERELGTAERACNPVRR
jgi:hypothetical protein